MLHNINQWEERIVMTYDANHPPFLNQEDRAEHFVKTVQAIVQNKCKLLFGYECGGHEDFLIFSENNDPNAYETLGYMEGKNFFLNGKMIYTLVKNMAKRDGIHIQAPEAVYFQDLLRAGVLVPSKYFKSRAYRRVNLGDGYSKFVGVSNDDLKIDVRALPTV